MSYRPSIGIGMLVGAFFADLALGRTGLIFVTALIVVYMWSTGEQR